MKIDRIHFYVEDASESCDWFVHQLGFQPVAQQLNPDTHTEIVKSGSVYFFLSSPLTQLSPVAQFLQHHPPGVADIAFLVEDVEAAMKNARLKGAKVLEPIQYQKSANGYLRWGKIAAWGSLTHTLVEQSSINSYPMPHTSIRLPSTGSGEPSAHCPITNIDHVVLNVPVGELKSAVAWYETILGFKPQQAFAIKTERSGLHSQVMIHPSSGVKFPINEPASPNSQIQEFLEVNRGAGVQHIALETPNLVKAIAQFRRQGVAFLPVPPTYYTQLQQRATEHYLSATELRDIAAQQILVDWQEEHPEALLLQVFTQPIFKEPTFFFELIERRSQAQGFGEGNFRALFEAIEREQMKRGSLQ